MTQGEDEGCWRVSLSWGGWGPGARLTSSASGCELTGGRQLRGQATSLHGAWLAEKPASVRKREQDKARESTRKDRIRIKGGLNQQRQ